MQYAELPVEDQVFMAEAHIKYLEEVAAAQEQRQRYGRR